jgi:class 3 adenylate cyclase
MIKADNKTELFNSAQSTGEILVSDMTRALAGAAGLRFDDRGTHALKGLDGEWPLAAYVAE